MYFFYKKKSNPENDFQIKKKNYKKKKLKNIKNIEEH